ncbi:MAG: CapA family protein [Gammaproteobacteria bacterium]|nr:MAG: CapA family protein [Gammaproteobacteria bacterium]
MSGNSSKRLQTPLLIGILLLAGCTSSIETVDEPPRPAPTPAVVEPPPPPGPTAAELAAERRAQLACSRITVAAAGDIMLGTDFPDNHLPDDDGHGMLAEVTPVFSSADIAFGNLEGMLLDGGEPLKKCKDPDACYLFRTPARYALHLANAGFTVMSLANNHARDFGEAGRSAAMASLAAAGIKHSGRAGDIATWPDGRVRAALIAFAPFTESNMMLDLEDAAAQVADLAADFDLVIVSFHGGAEGVDASRIPFTTETYYGENRGDVVKFSRLMVDSGADLVIGHGPHVPRAMEVYNEKLIAYSLGNFATYYGISVTGLKAYAPILVATLDGNGQFVSGEIVSAIQIRPNGPALDGQNRAYERIWELTEQDFDGGGIRFQHGGHFFPAEEPSGSCAQFPNLVSRQEMLPP